MRVHPARHEPGGLADDHRLLAHRARQRLDAGDRLVGGLEAAHDLDQLHLLDRVEEVHPAEAPRVAERGGQLGDAQRGRVRGEDGGWGRDRVETREQIELDRQLLRRGLDDELRVAGRLLERDRAARAAPGRRQLQSAGQLPAARRLPAAGRFDDVQRPLERVGRRIVEPGRAARHEPAYAMPCPIVPAPRTQSRSIISVNRRRQPSTHRFSTSGTRRGSPVR